VPREQTSGSNDKRELCKGELCQASQVTGTTVPAGQVTRNKRQMQDVQGKSNGKHELCKAIQVGTPGRKLCCVGQAAVQAAGQGCEKVEVKVMRQV
jgi:hypothetical protein